MKKVRIFLVFLLLLPANSLWAQWSGEVEADGGLGLMRGLRGDIIIGQPKYLRHGLGEVDATFTYKKQGFTWKNNLTGSFEPINKDYFNGTLVYTDPISKEFKSLTGVYTTSHETPLSLRYRTDLTWKPAPGRSGTAWFLYRLKYNNAYNFSIRYILEKNTGYFGDEPESWSHDFETGTRFSRDLGSSRKQLSGELRYAHLYKKMTTVYTTVDLIGPDDDMWEDIYRLTPDEYSHRLSGVMHFKDSLLTGSTKLVLDPGLRIKAERAIHDNSGATADINGSFVEDGMIWRDSTEIRERFLFHSLDVQPYLAADFVSGPVSAHVNYALSIYGRQLTDSTHTQGMRIKKPYVIGDGNITWRMGKGHSLTFSDTLSLNYPTYLQVCWFDRSAGFMDRLYRGNPSLKPNYTRKYYLKYKFDGKHFKYNFDVSYVRSGDKIVQTWFNEQIDGRDYRIITWVNGLDSRRVGGSQRIGYKGKVMSAGLYAAYYMTYLRYSEKDEVDKKPDWNLKADVGFDFGKGWKFSADAEYQSEVATFFALFDDYCVVNAKVSKEFKNLTLYLEGRDLADTPQDVRILSEDGSQLWRERTYHNRRLIVLGVNYSF